jgi:FMN phosphatase YigB (HAD superfamily)
MNNYTSGTIDPDRTKSITNPVQLVLFDLGGVLVTLTPQRRSACFAEEFDIGQDRLNSFLVSIVREQFNTGRINATEFLLGARKFFGLNLQESVFRACWMKLIGSIVIENLTIAAYLRESGFRVGLLSNTDPWHWEYIRDLEPAFAHFDPLFTSFELGMEKPDIGIYTAISDNQTLQPAEILLIDDSAVNLESARAAGWQVHHLVDNRELISLASQLTGQTENSFE